LRIAVSRVNFSSLPILQLKDIIMKYISFALSFVSITIFAAAQPFLHTKGKEIVTADGKPFVIKGTNLGNWLVPEGYMFHYKKATSPRLINETLIELIGPSETDKFWRQYVKNYITQADIHFLKIAGVNSIRLPFHYRLFTNENYLGGSGSKRAFAVMDSLVKWV